ncbi:SRPBCC family protein [Mycolicibacterium arseniciresistens]|uniref:SRPBCC family protein n=1 Tax=Mycolicibacterium arseniciresistens TaxID=3062257 RepID=A0ABT8U9G7_9MYCO|nr:SRPBCC family protein [Mycolicibacterium arseniciresistens]MDO3634430.1 SRPBCC family protein [Mycolicibacterium arseniciresistens]
MKLQHQTEVGASPEHVWKFLQDTAAVVECMPGAELVDDLGDDRYEGVLRVAIGPLKMNYAGRASVVERDDSSRRIVLDATGRDKRGSGSVVAHVAMQIEPVDTGTRIDVVSDIDLTGRIASLGRGIRDVSNQMFTAFADELADRIEQPGQPAPAVAGIAAGNGQRTAAAATTAEHTPPAAPRQRPPRPTGGGGEIKVLPLIWMVTRERLAGILDRAAARVRPN